MEEKIMSSKFAIILTFTLSLGAYTQPYNFDGIVKLENCSGSLIKFENHPLGSNALVLTSGHCIALPSEVLYFQSIITQKISVLNRLIKRLFAINKMLDPGQVIYNKLASIDMQVFNNNLDLIPIKAKKILYATMTDTDLAIYELNTSYLQLQMQGVKPFTLSSLKPQINLPIHIISGYWERGYSCHIENFVYQLKEAQWTFKDSIRYSATGCETIGGTSGSPILVRGKNLVVGVNNTSNTKGYKCSLDNPCEIDAQGNMQAFNKRSYGQQTYNIYSCLNQEKKFDLTLAKCMLPKGKNSIQ